MLHMMFMRLTGRLMSAVPISSLQHKAWQCASPSWSTVLHHQEKAERHATRTVLMCTPSVPSKAGAWCNLTLHTLLHDSLAVAAHKADAGVNEPVKELLQALLPCSSHTGWQL